MTTAQWLEEARQRRQALREIVRSRGCDAGLVFGTAERDQAFRYVTHFAPVLGDMYAIVGARTSCVLQFDWQFEEARERSGIDDWTAAFDPVPLVAARLCAEQPRRVAGFGLSRIPARVLHRLQQEVPRAEFVDATDDLDRLRRVKSPAELALLRTAAGVTAEAIDAAGAELREGQTEREIAARLMYLVNVQGAGLSFPAGIMSGLDSGAVFRMPTARALRAGDTVMIDAGASWEGYQADLAWTFVLGAPSAAQRRAWEVVERAYQAVVAAARPGVPCRALHDAAAAVITGAGYIVRHRMGHGIGLATSQEWPSLDSETAPLEAGMTVAVEPAVYGRDIGVVKREENLVITATGCESLSTRRSAALAAP